MFIFAMRLWFVCVFSSFRHPLFTWFGHSLFLCISPFFSYILLTWFCLFWFFFCFSSVIFIKIRTTLWCHIAILLNHYENPIGQKCCRTLNCYTMLCLYLCLWAHACHWIICWLFNGTINNSKFEKFPVYTRKTSQILPINEHWLENCTNYAFES